MALQKVARRVKRYFSHPSNHKFEKPGYKEDESSCRGDAASLTTIRRQSCVSQVPAARTEDSRTIENNATVRSQPERSPKSPRNFSRKAVQSYFSDEDAERRSLNFEIDPNTQKSDIPYLPPLRPISSHWDLEAWMHSNRAYRTPSPMVDQDAHPGVFEMQGSHSSDNESQSKQPTRIIKDACEGTASIGLKAHRRRTSSAVETSATRLKGSVGEVQVPIYHGDFRENAISPTSCKDETQESISPKSQKLRRRKTSIIKPRPSTSTYPIVSPRWTFTDIVTNMDEVLRGSMFEIEVDRTDLLGKIQPVEQDVTVSEDFSLSSKTNRLQRDDVLYTWTDTPTSSPMTRSYFSKYLELPTIAITTSGAEARSKSHEESNTKRDSLLDSPTRSPGMEIKNMSFPYPPPVLRERYNVLTLPHIPNTKHPAISPVTQVNVEKPPIPKRSSRRPKPYPIRQWKVGDSFASPDIAAVHDVAYSGGLSEHKKELEMAVSGILTTYTEGKEEGLWEIDEAELDEIEKWWAGFGYSGIGRLVHDDPEDTAESYKSEKSNGKSSEMQEYDKSHGCLERKGGVQSRPGDQDRFDGPESEIDSDSIVHHLKIEGNDFVAKRPSLNDIRRLLINKAIQTQNII
ncbi:hypothetical protein F5884DRAFT_856517 [Xylogone sp. PMI_703]|nr:hypothetical protein F5884DRAFT_856517 [Xylogone sp. PMI_703]